jgi:hypothetical protein
MDAVSLLLEFCIGPFAGNTSPICSKGRFGKYLQEPDDRNKSGSIRRSAWGMVFMQLSMQLWRTIRSKTGPGSRSVNQCLYGASGNMRQSVLLETKKLHRGRGKLRFRPRHRFPETLSREGGNRMSPVRISFNESEAYDQRNDKERGNEKRKVD